jgi:hypothetical protein
MKVARGSSAYAITQCDRTALTLPRSSQQQPPPHAKRRPSRTATDSTVAAAPIMPVCFAFVTAPA